jgi:hypothetical protein
MKTAKTYFKADSQHFTAGTEERHDYLSRDAVLGLFRVWEVPNMEQEYSILCGKFLSGIIYHCLQIHGNRNNVLLLVWTFV